MLDIIRKRIYVAINTGTRRRSTKPGFAPQALSKYLAVYQRRKFREASTMDHNTSYMNTNYAREKMIESYHREEAEKLTAKEVKGKGRDNPPAPEKDDDRQNN
jgi:hypothetical protein